jgi:hypothetical protein
MTDNSIIVEDCQTLDDDILALVQQAREHQNTIAEILNAIYDIKERLVPLLEVRGIGWSDDDGYARLAQEDLSIVYNARALDELILSDPTRFGWLREHRSEIAIPQRVLMR